MPIEYRGPVRAPRGRDRVGLFDLSHLGKVDVVGASAFRALQGLFTNDLRKVEVGRAQYHHLLNDRGGVEEDLFVYRLGDERWFLVPNAANKDKVVSVVRAAGAEAIDHDDWCFLGVQGPRSYAVVSKLWRTAVELAFRGCRTVDWKGTEVVLARTGYTGERGYELFATHRGRAQGALTTAGQPRHRAMRTGRATCSA
jgi:aminomethyltransferase